MDVDDVWASMNGDNCASGRSVADILVSAERKKTKPKKNEAKQIGSSAKVVSNPTTVVASSMLDKSAAVTQGADVRVSIEAKDMRIRIMRLVECIGSSDVDVGLRKSSLQKLHRTLFVDFSMTEGDYSEVFRDIAKAIFKRFADPVEKCREVAFGITRAFFEHSGDLVVVLGYFIPALMQRMPDGMAYDQDMKVFVFDKELHEAYRRGKAVDRQDKGDSLNSYAVVETSEEIRLLGCSVLVTLIRKLCSQGAASVLHPYFYDMVIFLQAQLRDPFAETKIAACAALEFLTTVDEFNTGLVYFAVGLVRSLLPVLRHRHAKVRVAALGALKACLSVPDRAKLRGAGTEAIPDLVGFREENVLQISAFYKSDVQINHLAELACDTSVQVREKMVEMLTVLLTEIGDRYDHQTRLLPYLLDSLTDDAPTVATAAIKCLQLCGKQYEEEHPDEIIERRQYGVDGDHRINLDKALPHPFSERPRIGVRLYVRGNTKRFLAALVNELTNWVSQTRCKSANLLKVIVVLCEEHITMEAHTLIPSFIKALGFSREDGDRTLHGILLQVYELVGRYLLPETYVHYILPRLVGDAAVTQFGVDAATRISVMEFLGAVLSGSRSSELIPHFEALADALTDPFVISPDSHALVAAAMDVMNQMLKSMRGKGNAAIQAHFLATGRLTSLKGTVAKCFAWYLGHLNNGALCEQATDGLIALSLIDSDSGGGDVGGSLKVLFDSYSHRILTSVAAETYPIDDTSHSILALLAECPFHSLQSQENSLEFTIDFLCLSAEELLTSKVEEGDPITTLYRLVVSILSPVAYQRYPITQCFAYSRIAYLVPGHTLDEESKQRGRSRPLEAHGLTAEHREAALRTSRRFLPRLLEAFIFNSHRSNAQAAQTARLEVLSVLVGAVPSDEAAAIYAGDILLSTFTRVVDTALIPATHPANRQELRFGAVQLLTRMFRCAVRCWHKSEDLSRLVKPFSYWEVADLAGSGKRTETQQATKSGLELALKMLDDSSDDVRCSALVALTAGVALIASDEDDASPSSFATIVSRLLRETAKPSNGIDFVDSLEALLRSLSILSPYAMKANIMLLQSEGSHSAVCLQADVLTHCETLLHLTHNDIKL